MNTLYFTAFANAAPEQQFAISADRIGDAVAYAMSQPEDASVNEITVRATAQEF